MQPTTSVQHIWDIQAVTKEKVVDLKSAIQEKQVVIVASEFRRAKAYPLSCLKLSGSFRSNCYLYDLKDQTAFLGANPSKWVGIVNGLVQV